MFIRQRFFAPETGDGAAPAPAEPADGEFDMPLDDDNLDSVVVAGEKASSENGAAPAAPASPAPGASNAPPTPPKATAEPPAAVPQPGAGTQQPPQAPAGVQPAAPQGQQPQPLAAPAAPAAGPGNGRDAAQPEDFSTSEGFVQGLQAHRNELIQHLATQRFALTQEEADELVAAPAAAVPRLMARVLVEAMGTIHKQIQSFVPPLISTYQNTQRRAIAAETSFYAKWPQIPRERGDEVDRIARAYRIAYPDASLEQVIDDVGEIAMRRMGLTAASPVQPAPGQAQPPVQQPPAAKPVPFAPAVGGPSGAQRGAATEEDPWAGFDLPS